MNLIIVQAFLFSNQIFTCICSSSLKLVSFLKTKSSHCFLCLSSCLCCSDLILFFSFSSNYNRDKVNDYLWYSVRDRGNLSIYILKLSTKSNIQGNKKKHIKIEWKLNFYRYFPNMQISKFGCLNWLKKCSTYKKQKNISFGILSLLNFTVDFYYQN